MDYNGKQREEELGRGSTGGGRGMEKGSGGELRNHKKTRTDQNSTC